MAEKITDLLERRALVQQACCACMSQDMRPSALALDSGILKSLVRQRPQSRCAERSIRRRERYEKMPASASRAASFEILQYRVTNLLLERKGLRPTSLRVIHNEDFIGPVEIAQHQPGDFTAAQPVDRKQREDCSRPQRSMPLPLHGFEKLSHLSQTRSNRQVLVFVDPWSLNAVRKTRSAPSS